MSIRQLERCIDLVRHEVSIDWSIQQFRIFLEIAQAGERGITQPQIGENMRLLQGVVSRNCRTLALFGTRLKDGTETREGHDLVYMVPDMYASRQLNARLTPKGADLYKRLALIMNKEDSHQHKPEVKEDQTEDI